MRRRRVLAMLGLLAACQRDALPPQITLEQVAREIAPPLARDAVVAESSPGAVRTATLHPQKDVPGSVARQSLVAPPPASIRLQVAVPPDVALRFDVGVDGAKRYERNRSGVEFRVQVNGRERFRATLNPAERGSHRGWREGSVDLSADAGRTVELVFETRAEDPERPLAGIPGWSHVRLVRRTTRARQRARAGALNLLVLLVDTLRADRLGVYDAHPSPSPALDRFAQRGLVFEDSVSQSSWTMPSVASLFTGLHPRSHGAPGIGMADGDPKTSGGFLADGLVTWAEVAQHAGITTVGIAANPLVGPASNYAQGFEWFADLGWDPATTDWHRAPEVNRRFLDWLDRHRAWRFVAYLHYMEPHDPYAPPPALRPPAPPGLRPAIAAGRISRLAKGINLHGAPPLSGDELAYIRQLYDAEVRAWDQEFGALLRGLDSAGVLDHTIVLVTADHGEEFQEHGRLKHGSQLYEETIRVPLIVAGPGIPAGRRPDTAQGIDVFPTITGLLGLEAPAGLPGRDLLATRDARDAIAETGLGILPGGGTTDVIALRTPRWKLIRTPALDRVELYDLQRDPGERTNDPGRGEAVALGERLDHWAAAAPPAPAPRGDGGDPALRAKLRALGYVE